MLRLGWNFEVSYLKGKQKTSRSPISHICEISMSIIDHFDIWGPGEKKGAGQMLDASWIIRIIEKISIWKFPAREPHQEHEVRRDRPALRGGVPLSTNNARESKATLLHRCPGDPGCHAKVGGCWVMTTEKINYSKYRYMKKSFFLKSRNVWWGAEQPVGAGVTVVEEVRARPGR